MEKPGVDKDGNAIWNPDGERQRYAEHQLGTLGVDRIFFAATQLMQHKGLIKEGSSVSPEEVYDWLQWLNLAQLRKLSRIAKSLRGRNDAALTPTSRSAPAPSVR